MDIKAIGRRIHETRFDALVQLLYSRKRSLSLACSKAIVPSAPAVGLRVLAAILQDPPTSAVTSMALRLRLLRSPASLDVGDAEGGIVCRCNRRVNILEDAMHFFHCPSSQGQFICRHNHIRDAIMDQIIGDSVDNQPGNEGPHIEVEWEPLVLARAPPTPDPPPSPPSG